MTSLICLTQAAHGAGPLVLYTDFGTKDGAVSEMKGVAYSVSPKLLISDLSHESPESIFAGAYRLHQVSPYWQSGTVFVTVIDPGVGTERLSVVLKTKKNHYFVGPNNGLLTFVAEHEGIAEVRQIDETINRLKGSEDSHTFHGRDVFGYTGARLASGKIRFEQVGPRISADRLVLIPYLKPSHTGNVVKGMIPVLDVQYGNVWSNIPKTMFDRLGVKIGDPVQVRIYHGKDLVDQLVAPYQNTFGEVPVGKPLVYVNSLMNISVALNLGSYAAEHKIESGVDWLIDVTPLDR
ncbi:SAM hydrolase/SAM-dependent halogenase family protein [Massilia sp. DWR3-1-1]|uniref:SAM hydrolase/SAM-dependent halogenase family protein n=1 Tax=Massilia sp. DWR3-1-1 TaxID=2804559 RepID=UPI003CE74C54